MQTKSCIKCGATDRYANGRCKPCHKEACIKWWNENPEKKRGYNTKWNTINPEKRKAADAKSRATHSEKRNAYNIKWREANPEAASKWYCANAEKVRLYGIKYRIDNPDKRRMACLNWINANPEKIRANSTKWAKANPEARRIHQQNRKARKQVNGGTISKGLAAKLFKLQKGLCPCCKQPLGEDYHLDHIMPIDLGGANEDWNIQLLRSKCNLQKSAKDPIAFMQSRGFLL